MSKRAASEIENVQARQRAPSKRVKKPTVVFSPSGENSVAALTKARRDGAVVSMADLREVASSEDEGEEEKTQQKEAQEPQGREAAQAAQPTSNKYTWEEIRWADLSELIMLSTDPAQFPDENAEDLQLAREKYLTWMETLQIMSRHPGKWQVTVKNRERCRQLTSLPHRHLGDLAALEKQKKKMEEARGENVTLLRTELITFVKEAIARDAHAKATAKATASLTKKLQAAEASAAKRALKAAAKKERAMSVLWTNGAMKTKDLKTLLRAYMDVHGNRDFASRSNVDKWNHVLSKLHAQNVYLMHSEKDDEDEEDSVTAEYCSDMEIQLKKIFREVKIDIGEAFNPDGLLRGGETFRFYKMPPKPTKPPSGGPKEAARQGRDCGTLESVYVFDMADGARMTRTEIWDYNDGLFDKIVAMHIDVSLYNTFAQIWDTDNTKEYILSEGKCKPKPVMIAQPSGHKPRKSTQLMEQYLSFKVAQMQKKEKEKEKKKRKLNAAEEAALVPEDSFSVEDWLEALKITAEDAGVAVAQMAADEFDVKFAIASMEDDYINALGVSVGTKCKLKEGVKAIAKLLK